MLLLDIDWWISHALGEHLIHLIVPIKKPTTASAVFITCKLFAFFHLILQSWKNIQLIHCRSNQKAIWKTQWKNTGEIEYAET